MNKYTELSTQEPRATLQVYEQIIELGKATENTLGLQGKYMEVGYRQPCWPGR
jgi:hypothetical protein